MRPVAITALVLLGACQDYNLQGQKPAEDGEAAIDVSPEQLGFPDVGMGETDAKNFTITSVGDVALEVTDLFLDTATAFSWAFPNGESLPLLLDPGASADVAITYTRETDADTDLAHVLSNDLLLADAQVLLNGGEAVAVLELDPPSWNAGAVVVGDTTSAFIDVMSVGGTAAVVDSITINGDGFSGTWESTLPVTLEPGEELRVEVSFTPPDVGVYTGELVVDSSNAGQVVAPLNGEGAGGPVAVCYADPSTVDANSQSTTFFGADSYDTGGRAIVTYDWTFVSIPSGSSAVMPAGTANRRFTPDLAGTYVAQLVVTNDLGQVSEACETELEAVPEQDLWIEMFWVHSGDDMDLHLLRPGGTLRSQNDCYYANTNPDWGTRGDPVDDPALDLDDIPGTGPENININEPENGTFTVYVNDYPGSSYSPGNDVTVNIYVAGVLAWSDTRTISGENADEAFAEIEWPSGVVTGL